MLVICDECTRDVHGFGGGARGEMGLIRFVCRNSPFWEGLSNYHDLYGFNLLIPGSV